MTGGKYCFFHSAAWAKVLAESYGYNPTYIVVYHNFKLIGLIPFMKISSIFTGKRGVSLPFTDFSASFIPNEQIFNNIFDEMVAFARKSGWRSLEIRGGTNIPESIPGTKSYYVHTLQLSDNERNMLQSFRHSTRSNINKAIRGKVKIEKYNSSEAMNAFYKLNCITRKKHGLPPQPKHFFYNFFDYIISQNKGDIFLAHFQNKIIGGIICLHMAEKVICKYVASDPQYLNVRPNNLIIWESIKFYGQMGFKSYCFGRTEPDNTGLLQFKTGWGTKQNLIHYYRYDLINNEFVNNNTKDGELKTRILKHIPLALLKAIGALAYKHFG